jgi:transcriptional repressor NrdR
LPAWKRPFSTRAAGNQSKEIGELVMQGLKDLDDVAYVRFASVYKEFKDVDTFMKELQRLLAEK